MGAWIHLRIIFSDWYHAIFVNKILVVIFEQAL